MNTQEFVTATRNIPRQNLTLSDKWPIALDIGYSSVKVFSPNVAAMFPSYAKRLDVAAFGQKQDYYIKYIDHETEEKWVVGQAAYDALATGDITDSVSELYGRSHYFSPSFKVLARVGLAMALQENDAGSPYGREIYVQTGLPSKYVKEDRPYITEVLSGTHHFSIQLGAGRPVEFNFDISPDNISVIPQPLGTLYSVCTLNDGTATEDAAMFFSTPGLVIDPGFGTLDTFPVQGKNDVPETFSDLGMKRVIEETISLIQKEYGLELTVPAMQQCLKKGTVRVLDRKTLSSTERPINKFLSIANEKVCKAAIMQILNSYNYLVDYNYIIITGGTGAAWEPVIKTTLANMETLTIVGGNRNDDLPMVFSNVRGYYLNLCNRIR